MTQLSPSETTEPIRPADDAAPRNEPVTGAELAECWPFLDAEERVRGLLSLGRRGAEDLFLTLPTPDQAALVLGLPADERRAWMRLLPPDDAADLVQQAPAESRGHLLDLLDMQTRREVGG